MLNLCLPSIRWPGAAMENATTDCAAFDETVVFLSYFKDLKDPRQQGKVTYPLDEIILLCLPAVLAGAETFVDIALFGCKKRELLRRFRPFENGTPAHDRLGDTLAGLDAEQFQTCFVAWVAALTGAPEGVIAIDGKTSRRSRLRLAATIKARWVCELAHQQLKQELGLGAFEGRSWTGLHRHALMSCIAFTYLQHLRLRAAASGKKEAARDSSAETDPS